MHREKMCQATQEESSDMLTALHSLWIWLSGKTTLISSCQIWCGAMSLIFKTRKSNTYFVSPEMYFFSLRDNDNPKSPHSIDNELYTYIYCSFSATSFVQDPVLFCTIISS